MIYVPKEEIDKTFRDIQAEVNKSFTNFEHLKQIDAQARDEGKLLHRYISFNVADGKVYYQIVKVGKRLCTLKLCVGINLDYDLEEAGDVAYTSDVMQLVAKRDKLEKIFSKKA